jgi:hypothetical protein
MKNATTMAAMNAMTASTMATNTFLGIPVWYKMDEVVQTATAETAILNKGSHATIRYEDVFKKIVISPGDYTFRTFISKYDELIKSGRLRETENDDPVDEDYSPDDPPGPETPPEFPAGTVKVDVSDVYDWYKLGQHISDLDGLGHHDFGQGPPSTVLAFGSEDQEEKYIKNLKKLGLKTHDIDPPGLKGDIDEAKLFAEYQQFLEGASGYIPSNAEKNDPRFKTALTVDVKPDTLKKSAKKMGFNISRAGIPPLLRK